MLSAGDILGSYEIIGLLGEGGVGVVYRVRHTILGVERALKVMHAERLASASIRDRFLAEARIQAQLRHPNIVAVTDVVAGPGIAGLVMDLVDGRNLAQDIAGRSQPPTPEQVRRLFLPILDAVGFAHDKGVVHRDIKPENILLDHDHRGETLPRITDFGIAKLLGELAGGSPAKHATLAERALGTHGYMSPEQIRSARDVDHRTDIFALGITLFEYATLTNPFLRDSDFDTMRAIVEGSFEIPRALIDRDQSLAATLAKALATRREDRFSSCAEFADAIVASLPGRQRSQAAEQSLQPAQVHAPTPLAIGEPAWVGEAKLALVRLAAQVRPRLVDSLAAVATATSLGVRRVSAAAAVPARSAWQRWRDTARSRWAQRAPMVVERLRAVRTEIAQGARDVRSGAKLLIHLPREHILAARRDRQRAERARVERVVALRGEASEARKHGDLSHAHQALQAAMESARRSERRQIAREIRAVQRAKASLEKATKRREKGARAAAERVAAAEARDRAKRERLVRAQERAARRSHKTAGPQASAPDPRPVPLAARAARAGRKPRITISYAWIALIAVIPLIATTLVLAGASPSIQAEVSKMIARVAPSRARRVSGVPPATPPVVNAPPSASVPQLAPPAVRDPMVTVPAGWFELGCTRQSTPPCPGDASPPKRVSVPGFRIGETEVTTEAFGRCVAAGACTTPKAGAGCNWGNSDLARHPMNCVDWSEAQAYCEWQSGRLPTEAEWEKSARGEDQRTYPWGNSPEPATALRANLRDDPPAAQGNPAGPRRTGDGYTTTAPVGSIPACQSPYGALDLIGNVWEWVADWYEPDSYARANWYAPTGPATGTLRVIRGGSYETDPVHAQAWVRNRAGPTLRSSSVGFRCAHDGE